MFRTAAHTVCSTRPGAGAHVHKRAGIRAHRSVCFSSSQVHTCAQTSKGCSQVLHVHSFPQSVPVCTQTHLCDDHEVTCAHPQVGSVCPDPGVQTLAHFCSDLQTGTPPPLAGREPERLTLAQTNSSFLRVYSRAQRHTHMLRPFQACIHVPSPTVMRTRTQVRIGARSSYCTAAVQLVGRATHISSDSR